MKKTILIIDDSPFYINILKDILQEEYEMISEKEGERGIQSALEKKPSLILLDIEMPGMDGFQVLKILKENEKTKHIPVIFLTGLLDPEYEEKGFLFGAADYINKPCNPNIVKVRVKTQIDLAEYYYQMEHQLKFDALTGVYNRRAMEKYLNQAWNDTMENQQYLSLVMIDIDYFKLVNDTYGHLKGDFALSKVASVLKQSLPEENSYIVRYGGEEFLLILPDRKEEQVKKIMEHIYLNLKEQEIPNENSPIGPFLTVSAGGICQIPKAEDLLSEFINKADKMLYQSKKMGRNRCSWYQP